MENLEHPTPLAVSYARAVLDLATEAKSAQPMSEELHALRQIIEKVPQFGQVLDDPAIGVAERAKLIHTTFDGRVSKLLLNVLGLLNEKGRLGLLASISVAYDELLDEQMGKMDVQITVPQPLEPKQLDKLGQQISDVMKRQATLQQKVDESIIGGLIVRVQDRLFDGSIRTQLTSIRQRLLAARPV
jgi:F-type H+-transporting ATPase subunit delta